MLSFFLYQFLQKHISYQKPLLLAYSGGGDSEALLQALLDCKKRKDFCLHVAHVDHGWRETSHEEAMMLKKKAQQEGLFFHLAKKEDKEEKNIEASSRDFRYRFFSALQEKYDYEAVFLAHHADDLAETVFKRIFEGSRLFYLGGMREVSPFLNMTLMRPFLRFSKKDLLLFLKKKEKPFLEDETNKDPFFLRNRIRNHIFPFLEKELGKNIQSSLCFFSKQIEEMKEHLEKKLSFLKQEAEKNTPFAKVLFLEKLPPLSRWELRYLLGSFFEKSLKREEEERLLEAFDQKKSPFFINTHIVWEKRYLFWLLEKIPPLEVLITEEGLTEGAWKVEVKRVKKWEKSSLSWEAFLQGSLTLVVPEGKYSIQLPFPGASWKGKAMKTFWSEKKIPVFLRKSLPVLCKDNVVVGEFGSGGFSFDPCKQASFFKISIKRKLI